MMPLGLPETFLILGIVLPPSIIATIVLRKAGFSIWWGLLTLVPLVNVIFLWVFSFIDWPHTRREGQ